MKKSLQEENINSMDGVQSNEIPVKRKRGRPPSKHKNQNLLAEIRSSQRITEPPNAKMQNEPKHLMFEYPPQIPFKGFDLDQNLKESNTSTQFFQNIINNVLNLWWNGSSPVLFDDSKIIKYELVFNILRFFKHLFDSLPPLLIMTNSDNLNQWVSTFVGYNSYLFSEDENDTESDLYYTPKSKTKLDVLVLSNDQILSELSSKTFSLLILDQPTNFDGLAYLNEFDIKSRFLISDKNSQNIPPTFDVEHSMTITLNDLKMNHYISEILHFCPMTLFQIRQTQQLFKTNKSRLNQNPEQLSERLTMFLSHMVQQVKSISVHPSLSNSYNGVDNQSGKFQELLKIVMELQMYRNKIAIIGYDSKLLTFTTSFFIKNKINAYNVNQLSKEKKKIQLIETYNESDYSCLLIIDPYDFTKYYERLIIDKIIILEVGINLTSMINEVLKWEQNQHYNFPQIIRLITDNSIELPIYDMQFENHQENIEENQEKSEDNQGEIDDNQENQEGIQQNQEVNQNDNNNSLFFDTDHMKSDTLLLLLKQSARLCFEINGEDIKEQINFCYSHPHKLFNIDTNFNSNFWNEITQIDLQEHMLQRSQQQNQKMFKQQIHSRSLKVVDDDNLSIANRFKNELMRRTRRMDQEIIESHKKTKIATRNSVKKSSKKIYKKRKISKRKLNQIEGEEEEENELSNIEDNDESQFESSNEEIGEDENLNKKKKSSQKLRQSPRHKSSQKYKDRESSSESGSEPESESVDEEEEENDDDNENKKSDLEDDNGNEEEEEEEAQEESENEFEESANEENDEDDENTSIASREKKRLKKKEQMKNLIKVHSKSSKKTKSSRKVTKRSARSESKKIQEREAQQKTRQRQAQLLQKPRKHIPKFEAMVSFWNLRHFTHYLELLRDYGFDRWDKFSVFDRPIQELRKIGALIIRNLETTSRENRLLREYFANELRSSELSRLDAALPFVRRKLSKSVVRNELLADLTGMLVLSKQAPRTPKDVVLPPFVSEVEPLDEEWTEDDDKTLLFLIHENGLLHIPSTFKHNLSKNFIKRFRSFYSIDPSNQTNYVSNNANANNTAVKAKGPSIVESKVSPKKKIVSIKGKARSTSDSLYSHGSTTTKSKTSRAIGVKQHTAIILNLCSYGFPNLYKFKMQMNTNVVNLTDIELQEYVDNIFNFCTCTNKDERKVLAQKLVGKIEKYTATKIITRKNMFEKLREDAASYDKISGEDIELLSAMAFHGFTNTDTSPILLSSCSGECSDQRLFQRVKAIAMQKQIHNEDKIPNFFSANEPQEEKPQEIVQQEDNQLNITNEIPTTENTEILQNEQENKENENNGNFEISQEDKVENNEILNNEPTNSNIDLENNNNDIPVDNNDNNIIQPINEINQDYTSNQQPPPPTESINQENQQEQPIQPESIVIPPPAPEQESQDQIEMEESLFPLKLNDRQVLKSIGTIDPRFHDEDRIYPIGYECAVACINPFADNSNLIWLNLSVQLLNTKISKKDKNSKSGDLLLFVVKKEREKSAEISDYSPDSVFEKVRSRIIRKTNSWIPPFDGNEMFGFNSSKVHRIFLQMPNIDECTNYKKRFFRLPMTIEHEWPILGRYDDKRKQMQMYSMFTSPAGESNSKSLNSEEISYQKVANSNNKQKVMKKLKHLNLKSNRKEKANQKLKPNEKSQSFLMKKKEFGALMKPLVINCQPIFDLDQKEASLSVSGPFIDFEGVMNRYEKWDEDIIKKYVPNYST